MYPSGGLQYLEFDFEFILSYIYLVVLSCSVVISWFDSSLMRMISWRQHTFIRYPGLVLVVSAPYELGYRLVVCNSSGCCLPCSYAEVALVMLVTQYSHPVLALGFVGGIPFCQLNQGTVVVILCSSFSFFI